MNSHGELHHSNEQINTSASHTDGDGISNKGDWRQDRGRNKAFENKMCHRFLRGVCKSPLCGRPHISAHDKVLFCHDFQNTNECMRKNCKFFHYSLQEEDFFKKHGRFPKNTLESESSFCRNLATEGICRLPNCRYRHEQIDLNQPRERFDRSPPYYVPSSPRLHSNAGYNERYDRERSFNNSPREFSHIKMAKIDTSTVGSNPWRRLYTDEIDVHSILRRLEEEHSMLLRRVELNEVKIAELKANNEYLMSQNAQFRASQQIANLNAQPTQIIASRGQPIAIATNTSQGQQITLTQPGQIRDEYIVTPTAQYRINSVQCSRGGVNSNTVTSTAQQQSRPTQMITAVSLASVQVQATPIVSIAGPQTQIIASNGSPLTIAANTSQGQQLTLTQQGLSTLSTSTQSLVPAPQTMGPPPQPIGPSSQTLGQPPPQILNSSQITLTPALTINTSQALAMSNATQPIISYPVVTHSILPH